MEKSLQTSLLKIIRIAYPSSASLDKLFTVGNNLGHKQSLVERKLRILVASGLIEVKKDAKGQNQAYKALADFERIYIRKDLIDLNKVFPPKKEQEQVRLFEPKPISF